MDHNRREGFEKREMEPDRNFYVRAPSINAVRRALDRAPGGAKVVGRHDRETILCTHTMDGHSLARHWKVIVSRLDQSRAGGRRAAAEGIGFGRAVRTKLRTTDGRTGSLLLLQGLVQFLDRLAQLLDLGVEIVEPLR